MADRHTTKRGGLFRSRLPAPPAGAGASMPGFEGVRFSVEQAEDSLNAAADRLSLPRLGVTDIFRFPVMADFLKHVATLTPASATAAPAAAAAPVAPAPAAPAAAAPAAADASAEDAMARRRALRAQLRGGK